MARDSALPHVAPKRFSNTIRFVEVIPILDSHVDSWQERIAFWKQFEQLNSVEEEALVNWRFLRKDAELDGDFWSFSLYAIGAYDSLISKQISAVADGAMLHFSRQDTPLFFYQSYLRRFEIDAMC